MSYPYETATEEQKQIGAWWWCVHHEIHVERLTEPPENRVKFIRENKPPEEIERRLAEFAPVLHPERLPQRLMEASAEYGWARTEYDQTLPEYNRAWAEYDRARAEYVRAQAEYNRAWAECARARAEFNRALAEYDRARAEYEPELMALHREEYPGTRWNGRSIFGEGA